MSDTPLQVRINQAAVVFDFKPADYEFEAEGGQYSFPYTAETALVATPDEYAEGWLTVEVTETEIVLKAEANTEVKTRASIVEWTIGSAKGEFEVSQKGAPATFEGEFAAVNAPVGGTTVVYEYTTNSELVVNSDDAWIEAYTEDSKLNIIVAPNSGSAREGVVTWSVKGSDKSGEIKVSQKGAFINVELVPNTYTGVSTSNLTNTLSLKMIGTNVTAIKTTDVLSEAEVSSLGGFDKIKEDVKTTGDDFDASWISAVNATGLNLTMDISLNPGTTYYVAIWATDGTDEISEVVSGATFTDTVNDELENKFYPISNKSNIFGQYHFIAKKAASITVPTGYRQYMGIVTLSDGGMIDDSGDILDMINVEGMWGTSFSQKYHLTNDITQIELYDNLLYNWDPEGLGELVDEKGSPIYDGTFSVWSYFSSGGAPLAYTMGGGIIDEDGIIGFIDLVDEDQTWGDGEKLGTFYGNALIRTSTQYSLHALLKDYMFIPVDTYTPAKAEAASRKLDAIKKEIGKSKRNYVEIRDSRLERAFETVMSQYKPEEVLKK